MRTAIITGASSGIGAATAIALGKAGFNVVLAARSIDKLEILKNELESEGIKAIAVKADVVKRDDMQNLAAAALKEFGNIDILVNNAGIMPLSFMKNLHQDEWDKMIDVNIKGVLNGVAAVLPTMMENKRGHIINISSVAGVKVFPSSTVYSGTKWAVEAITEGLRMELSKNFNLRTTVIRPGATESNLTSTITDAEVGSLFAAMEIEAIKAEDIANAIVYAASQPENVNVNEILVRPTSQDLL
ncbi:MAG: oxidoreductase [Ignavibacteriae bacterium HGW-Ignavibacteriae-2]|jgi:hypothetical protein|nr:MAG: oxidoreductase [Ignavibacteriae bacterium HGW-Ignavibacteriae-2]